MSAVTASLCWTLLFVVFVSADEKFITAESGQDVTLTCRAPNNNKIIVAEWRRADLGDEYVLLYRDGHFGSANQHPSFKNRVDLQDRQMKDGDVSLILKNVTNNDAGTYECRVFMEEAWRWSTISIIYLVVAPPDERTITAESGQDVTLTCRAPNNNKIIVLKWSRTDLKPEDVFLYWDGHFGSANQHPSFKNRVDLQDRQMKDGDVSLILKDVTTDDAGTYVCGLYMQETRSWTLSIINLIVVPPDPKILKADSGQDVTLTCRAPNNKVTAVVWSRADLKQGFMLFHRDGRLDPDNQHPSLKNRVDLQDRQMKDGDVSLILKDVTTDDAGTYMCGVYMEGTRSFKHISIIYLIVPPGILGGFPVWMVALIVFLGILLGVLLVLFIFLIYTNIQKQSIKLRKQVRRSAGFSKLNSEYPPVVSKSHCYRRKTDDQGPKETDDADLHLDLDFHLQPPQLDCESDDLRTDINKLP